MSDMEQLGGMVQCIASREGVFYCVDVLRENLEPAMDILAETVLDPLLPQQEIDDCKQIVLLQQSELPAEILSRDAVQMAAFKGSPLGNSHFCPISRIEEIDVDLIKRFRMKHLTGKNCFIAGAGVEHESFVKLVQKKFGSLPMLPTSGSQHNKDISSAFIGGIVKDQRDLKEPFIKVAIAFEVGGWHDSGPLQGYQTVWLLLETHRD